jgi:two-component system, cell cycle response regulator
MTRARILFVEDDKLQAKITKDYLESSGYEVILAEDGKAAIKTAKTQKVDIILLDLVLPDISGNEVCRWLKMNHDTKGIPIIMLTVRSSTMEKVEGLKAGADDYLPKPYNEIELNARIYASLRTKALQDELREKNRELQDTMAKLELLSRTDPLTELFNRRHFVTVIDQEFSRTQRYKSPAACIMIDVDHFKDINDKYGHNAGDLVLKEIAGIIRSCLRQIDTVARWGGEEFIVLLPGTSKENALHAASKILTSVSDHKFHDIDRHITVSIGLASIPNPSIDTFEKFIHASDLALYEAKSKGRNRIETTY